MNPTETIEFSVPRAQRRPQAGLLLLAVGLSLLVGGIGYWLFGGAPQSDQQRVEAKLETLRVAVEERDARSILGTMGQEFEWNGVGRKMMKDHLANALFRWRDVRLNFAKPNVRVQGDKAWVSGRFGLTFRPGPDNAPETHTGPFSLEWRKVNGDWHIATAKGAEELLRETE